MFPEIVLFSLAGIGLGVFTGLLPGIHPNTLFLLLLSLSAALVQFPVECVVVFIVSVAVSNTFTDFIPSIFLGAPDPEAALSVLPGHRLLLAGRGYEALFLSVAGGIGVILITTTTLPLLFILLPGLYSLTRPVIHILLLLVVAWMVLSEKRNAPAALAVFILTGTFGFISLNTLSESASMFPALTGMFGISTLIVSFRNRTSLPKQEHRASMKRGTLIRGSVTGWLAGLLSGLLPGIGAAQAGALASEISRTRRREFLVALGGINTSNILFTLLVFYLIGKVRSGASHAISQLIWNITFPDLFLILSTSAFVCFVSAAITLYVGRRAAATIGRLDYSKISILVVLSLVLMVLLLSGPTGVLVCLTGTLAGLSAILSGVRRTHMMGFLILPTILYFSGLQNIVMFTLGI
jgi:putative membrane protein